MSDAFRQTGSRIARPTSIVLFTLLALFVSASSGYAQISVKAGDTRDSRTTGNFFGGFEIELLMSGASLAGAKSMRVLVSTAVDETGRNILKESQTDFEDIGEDETEASVKIKMKNPSRSAMTIREITGSVEIYAPAKDPASIVTVTNISKSIGIPVNSPALKAAGIEITIWDKQQYEARKKAEEEKLKKSQGEGNIGDALMGLFSGLMDIFGSMDENSIAFQIKDPQLKIVSIEIQNAAGESIGSGGMTMGDAKQKTRTIDLQEKLPADARVKIHVLTAKSMTKAPFKLEKVTLP